MLLPYKGTVNSGNSQPRRHPRNHPSLPSLRTESREKTPSHHVRANTLCEIPAAGQSTASLPAKSLSHSRSSSVDSQMTPNKESNRRQACDFRQELALAYRELMEQQARTRRPAQTSLPPIRTQEIGYYNNSPSSRTPSSTYSSSLYTTDDAEFDFPLPPAASPELLGFCKDAQMFSEEETGQINSFLRERYNGIDTSSPTLIRPRDTPSSVPSSLCSPSRSSRDTDVDLNWTPDWDGIGLGDFSWEACSQGYDDEEMEDADNILGKIGLLDDGVWPSSGPHSTTLKQRSPLALTHLRTVKEDDVDEVSIVLDALRSTFDLGLPEQEDPMEESSSEDHSGSRDKVLAAEVASRLREKRSQEVAKVAQRRGVLALPASRSDTPTPSDPGDRRTLRLSNPQSMHLTPPPAPPPKLHMPQLCYQPNSEHLISKRSSAYERMESSISRLNEFGPRVQVPRSYSENSAPVVPPKDRTQDAFLPVTPKTRLSRSPGIVRKRPSYDTAPRMAKLVEEPHREVDRQVHRSASLQTVRTVTAVEYNDRERNRHDPHTRSPSAPLLSHFQGPTKSPAPPFSIRRPFRKESLGRLANYKGTMPYANSRHSSANGLRSFMDSDGSAEEDTRDVSRARFSQFPPFVSAAGHAEKAKKLLARASSTMTSWGKGLARAGSYHSKKEKS